MDLNRSDKGADLAKARQAVSLRPEGFFGAAPTISGTRPQFHYNFRNHGKSLAVIRRFRDYSTFNLTLATTFQEPWDARPIQYIPIVGEEAGSDIFCQIPEGSTVDMVQERLGRREWIYIVGEVEYSDIFARTWIHGYCLRIMSINAESGGIGMRFWRDGGIGYNRRYQPS